MVDSNPDGKRATSSNKVDVLLKPVGDVPGMQKNKWKVGRTDTVCSITDFIRRYLKLRPQDSLFIYVTQSFAPPPDTQLGTLFACYGLEGKLILNYCKAQAWG